MSQSTSSEPASSDVHEGLRLHVTRMRVGDNATWQVCPSGTVGAVEVMPFSEHEDAQGLLRRLAVAQAETEAAVRVERRLRRRAYEQMRETAKRLSYWVGEEDLKAAPRWVTVALSHEAKALFDVISADAPSLDAGESEQAIDKPIDTQTPAPSPVGEREPDYDAAAGFMSLPASSPDRDARIERVRKALFGLEDRDRIARLAVDALSGVEATGEASADRVEAALTAYFDGDWPCKETEDVLDSLRLSMRRALKAAGVSSGLPDEPSQAAIDAAFERVAENLTPDFRRGGSTEAILALKGALIAAYRVDAQSEREDGERERYESIKRCYDDALDKLDKARAEVERLKADRAEVYDSAERLRAEIAGLRAAVPLSTEALRKPPHDAVTDAKKASGFGELVVLRVLAAFGNAFDKLESQPSPSPVGGDELRSRCCDMPLGATHLPNCRFEDAITEDQCFAVRDGVVVGGPRTPEAVAGVIRGRADNIDAGTDRGVFHPTELRQFADLIESPSPAVGLTVEDRDERMKAVRLAIVDNARFFTKMTPAERWKLAEIAVDALPVPGGLTVSGHADLAALQFAVIATVAYEDLGEVPPALRVLLGRINDALAAVSEVTDTEAKD